MVQKRLRSLPEPDLHQTCTEIQEHIDCNETSTVYKKIRQIAQDLKPRTTEIKKEDGRIVWDCQGILNSWESYCEWLYQDYGARAPANSVLTIKVTSVDE